MSIRKVRLDLKMDAATRERAKTLKDSLEAASLATVIRMALRLLEMCVKHREQGGALVLRSPDGSEKTVEILF